MRTTTANRVSHRTRSGHLLSRVVAVCAAALAVTLAGCNSTSTSGTATTAAGTDTTSAPSSPSSATSSAAPSYPAGKQQLCQARDQLSTSMSALVNPSTLQSGASGIKTAVDKVQTDLNAVVAAGKQDYQPQVTALQSALQQVQTAVADVGSGNIVASLPAIASAISAAGKAGTALFSELTTACSS